MLTDRERDALEESWQRLDQALGVFNVAFDKLVYASWLFVAVTTMKLLLLTVQYHTVPLQLWLFSKESLFCFHQEGVLEKAVHVAIPQQSKKFMKTIGKNRRIQRLLGFVYLDFQEGNVLSLWGPPCDPPKKVQNGAV